MGWKTDWLYRLLFSEVARLWNRASKEAASSPEGEESSPEAFLIREFTQGDTRNSRCLPPVRRQWIYRGESFEEITNADAYKHTNDETIRGMFFTTSSIAFHITPDRKQVIFLYALGPRYGKGRVYLVHHQGSQGSLIPDQNAIGWIA
jgi:hypothetical protein